MKKRNFDFFKNLPKFLIGYGVIIVACIVMALISGIKLDIQFSGGSQATYSFSGDIKLNDIESVAQDTLKTDVTVSESASYTDDTSKKFTISVSNHSTIDAEQTDELLKALQEEFKDNNVKQEEIISVSASIGTNFFFKCLVAVALAGVLVVIYVAFRFRKIGGWSAGLFSLIGLVLDILVAFSTCVILGITIDSNFITVILTLLGYSLNDTIVVFDKVRENKRIMGGDKDIKEIVNVSNNECVSRNIMTTLATFLAIMTILVVAEINGLATLRSLTIPLAFGMISGSVSSLCVAPILWGLYVSDKSSNPKKRKSR